MLIPETKIKFKLPVDDRGKITSGKKGALKEGGQKSLDYFRVDDFEEIVHYYGNKPEKLIVLFPPGPIEDYFQFYKCEWGLNNRAKRRCDTDHFSVTYKQGEFKPGVKYPCQSPDCQCKWNIYFNCFIATPPPHPTRLINNFQKTYLFRTGSENNGYKIFGMLKMNEQHLFGQPFILSVKPVTDGQNHYPVWNIEALPHLDKQLQQNLGGMLPIANPGNLLESGEELSKAGIEVFQNRAVETKSESDTFKASLEEEANMNLAIDTVKSITSIIDYDEYCTQLKTQTHLYSEVSKERIREELTKKKEQLIKQSGQ